MNLLISSVTIIAAFLYSNKRSTIADSSGTSWLIVLSRVIITAYFYHPLGFLVRYFAYKITDVIYV